MDGEAYNWFDSPQNDVTRAESESAQLLEAAEALEQEAGSAKRRNQDLEVCIICAWLADSCPEWGTVFFFYWRAAILGWRWYGASRKVHTLE